VFTRIASPDDGFRLAELAGRMRRLRPDHRDPEAYYIEKSEIEHELRQLARQLGAGGRP
jgi:hypothetical protein